MKTTRLTKVVNRHVERAVDYATPEGVFAFLHDLVEKRGLPLFRMLEILAEGHVNSVSFTRNSPYLRFYAYANGGNRALISLDTGRGEYETVLDLSKLGETQHYQS